MPLDMMMMGLTTSLRRVHSLPAGKLRSLPAVRRPGLFAD